MKQQPENIKGMSLEKKEGQLVTRYIKNWADSAKFQVISSHLTLCGLTVNRSEMPNFSYTQPSSHLLYRKTISKLLFTKLSVMLMIMAASSEI
jgi:hypothetical protein